MEEQRGGCLPDLPLEVWNEVLLRVPADSLVHFKRVCKGWCGLIGSDRFVESHLERWRPRPAMVLFQGIPDTALVPLGFEGEQLESRHAEPCLRDCLANALAELREGVARTRFKGAYLRAFDSCDGLILFGVCFPLLLAEQLLVCNPITKSFVLLPPCDSFSIEDFEWTITGSGASASSQGYKIIGIPVTHCVGSSPTMTCFVLDLRRGGGGREPSSWKGLHMDVPWDYFSRLLGPVLSVGQKVHWLIELVRGEKTEPVLVSLDLSTERLSHTKILPEKPTFNGWTQSCWLYSDRVMCWLQGGQFSGDDLLLWVLEDLDSQPVWRKRHVLPRPPEGSKCGRIRWTGIYMESEGKIVIDEGLVYSSSSRCWSRINEFDSAHGVREVLCPHVNSLVKFD